MIIIKYLFRCNPEKNDIGIRRHDRYLCTAVTILNLNVVPLSQFPTQMAEKRNGFHQFPHFHGVTSGAAPLEKRQRESHHLIFTPILEAGQIVLLTECPLPRESYGNFWAGLSSPAHYSFFCEDIRD